MKKFKIPCKFNEDMVPFDLYVGKPSEFIHPLFYQKIFLKRERGGEIPEAVLESFKKLQDIAIENNVDFEELTMYALGSAANPKS